MKKLFTSLALAATFAAGASFITTDPAAARRGGACKVCDVLWDVKFCRASNQANGFRRCSVDSDRDCSQSGWCRLSEPE